MRKDIQERNDRLCGKIRETLIEDYGAENISSLSKNELVEYCKKHWIKENHAAATIKHYVYFVNMVLKEEKNETILKVDDFSANKDEIANILSKDDIEVLMTRLANPQDKAIVYCLFKSIRQKEIMTLKIDQVDLENKQIILSNRIINMDDKFADLMKAAIDQKIYYDDKDILLNDRSEYVFKPKPNKKNNNGFNPFSYNSFVSRMRRIRNITSIFITPDLLLKSGAINDIIENYGYTAMYSDVDEYCKKQKLKIGTNNLLISYREFIMNKLH